MRGTKMGLVRGAVFFAVAGISSVAISGTIDAFTIYPALSGGTNAEVVVPYATQVTYKQPSVTVGKKVIPAMNTYAGYAVGDQIGAVLLKNTSGNTVNNVKIVISAWATDTAELLTVYQPEVYLPDACTYATVSTPASPSTTQITCDIGQLKTGDTFGSFKVFFAVPEKHCTPDGTNPCGGVPDDYLPNDKITTSFQLLYAEGANGPGQVQQNSNSNPIPQSLQVTLGTSNPKNVKSAVPKSGTNVYTGNLGIPRAPTLTLFDDGVQFTELLTVPKLTGSYTVGEVIVTSVNDADCTNLGHFKACPNYQTDVNTADGVVTRFTDPANPMEFVYRIDSSYILMPPVKLLNSVEIRYTGARTNPDGTTIDSSTGLPLTPWSNTLVTVCTNGGGFQPNTNGLPCIKAGSAFCYKKSDTNGVDDLIGDCEWTLLNNGNGSLKIQ